MRTTIRPKLSLDEQLVLILTDCMTPAAGKNERERLDIPDEVWEAAKSSLIRRGLLRKNGAITNEGRNATGNQSDYQVIKAWEATR